MSHAPTNINILHRAEQDLAGWNTKIAVSLTKVVGTMETAYLFAVLACIGLLGILGIMPPLVALLVVWISQTFLQLVFLPILSVGQNVLSRHQELQADETYETTMKMYADAEEIKLQLSVQSEKIVEILAMLKAGNHDKASDTVQEN